MPWRCNPYRHRHRNRLQNYHRRLRMQKKKHKHKHAKIELHIHHNRPWHSKPHQRLYDAVIRPKPTRYRTRMFLGRLNPLLTSIFSLWLCVVML